MPVRPQHAPAQPRSPAPADGGSWQRNTDCAWSCRRAPSHAEARHGKPATRQQRGRRARRLRRHQWRTAVELLELARGRKHGAPRLGRGRWFVDDATQPIWRVVWLRCERGTGPRSATPRRRRMHDDLFAITHDLVTAIPAGASSALCVLLVRAARVHAAPALLAPAGANRTQHSARCTPPSPRRSVALCCRCLSCSRGSSAGLTRAGISIAPSATRWPVLCACTGLARARASSLVLVLVPTLSLALAQIFGRQHTRTQTQSGRTHTHSHTCAHRRHQYAHFPCAARVWSRWLRRHVSRCVSHVLRVRARVSERGSETDRVCVYTCVVRVPSFVFLSLSLSLSRARARARARSLSHMCPLSLSFALSACLPLSLSRKYCDLAYCTHARAYTHTHTHAHTHILSLSLSLSLSLCARAFLSRAHALSETEQVQQSGVLLDALLQARLAREQSPERRHPAQAPPGVSPLPPIPCLLYPAMHPTAFSHPNPTPIIRHPAP